MSSAAPSKYIDEEDLPEIVRADLAVEASAPVDEAPDGDRLSYIGGSEAYDACIGDRLKVYLLKTGELQPDDLSGVEPVAWGSILEAVVANQYQERNGVKIQRRRRLVRHPRFPFIGAHIDRLILDGKGILEVKTTGLGKMGDWGDEAEEVPPRYLFQVQHYLGVLGREYVDFAVLFGGQFYRQFRIERDEAFISNIVDLEGELWDRIQRRDPPDPADSAGASRRWPKSVPAEVQADAMQAMAARRLARIRRAKKVLEDREGEMELVVKAALADRGDTLMEGKEKLATWKTQSARRFDSKALQEAEPELYERFRKETESRVLRLHLK